MLDAVLDLILFVIYMNELDESVTVGNHLANLIPVNFTDPLTAPKRQCFI